MNLSSDFYDLLVAFEEAGAEYLLIGGYAVSLHSEPRYTKDIDLWIESSPANLERVAEALEAFGVPARAIDDVKTSAEDEIVWFGHPPGRVDILKRIPGVEFYAAYRNRARIPLGDKVVASVISIGDLIAAKLAAGRVQDLLDVEALRAVRGRDDD